MTSEMYVMEHKVHICFQTLLIEITKEINSVSSENELNIHHT